MNEMAMKREKFIQEEIKPNPGRVINTETNEIIGTHIGLNNYTIGQRKGLGISYKHPLYVTKIDVPNNQVVLGTEEELYSKEAYITDTNILVDNLPTKAQAKIRYKSKPVNCTYGIIDNNNIKE